MPSRRSTVATSARASARSRSSSAASSRRRIQQFVERAAVAQHAFDDVGGDAADGEAGHVVGLRRAVIGLGGDSGLA